MQRRHYELLANAINEARELNERQFGDRWPLTGQSVVEHLADALQDDNPNFDRERFFAATGLKEDA